MHILNVNMTIDPVNGGGTVERTCQISKFLTENGAKCTILTTSKGLTTNRVAELQGINVVVLPCINDRFYIPRIPIMQLKRLIGSCDIIHLMGHWTLLNAIVYIYARFLKKPYVISPAGELVSYGRSRILKFFFGLLIGRKIIKNASAYIAVTTGEIPQFEAFGISAEQITVIPNGVNPRDFSWSDDMWLRQQYDLDAKKYCLFVGRLAHIKGADLLLKAFHNVQKQLSNMKLVFVGPDQGMKSLLEAFVIKHELKDKVAFIGYLGGQEKSAFYHGASFLVIPSRHEAMSIVALEAGVCKVPVLLTNQCGFDAIQDINGGMVVEATAEGIGKV